MSKIKDSGKREQFDTGAHRDTNEGKGAYNLLPPLAIHRIAQHFQEGAKKYSPNNYRKGIPTDRYIDSALRHIFQYLDGQQDEPHLVSAAWNILCCIETKALIERDRLPESLDRLPYREGEKTKKDANV